MILIDTSAWVEYLRGTGSRVDAEVRRLIEETVPIATTDTVVMELLAGARDEQHAADLRRMALSLDYRPMVGLLDFEQAASLYRLCRRAGETVRSLMDCLVAAVAMRDGLSVLAHDRDFEVIARHGGLELVEP